MTAVAVGSLLLGSCGTDPDAGQQLFVGDGLVEPVGGDLASLVDGMTAFGHDLHAQVAEPGENVVLSPASIAIAFGMARAGAKGTTAEEIDAVLGFPADAATTHASFNELIRTLETAAPGTLPAEPEARRRRRGGVRPPALAIANSVFPADDAAGSSRSTWRRSERSTMRV